MESETTEEMLAALRRHPAFTGLDDPALAALAPHLSWVDTEAGDRLVRRGEEADRAYLIDRGNAIVELGESQQAARLGPGDLFGEIAVLAGGTRAADVVAATDLRVLAIPAPVLRDLVRDADVWKQLIAEAGERLRQTRLLDQLNRLFGPVDLDLVRQLSPALEWVSLPAGTVLFEQGEVSDSAYFVVGGRLRVAARDDEGQESVVADVGSGELIGEMGLLDAAPRNATIWAARDSELVRFPRRVFEGLVGRYPLVTYEVAKTVLRRTRVPAGARTQTSHTSIVLIPHGSVALSDLARRLASALAGMGSTEHLTREKVDGMLGRPGAANAALDDPESMRLSELLNELAEQHRFTLLEGSAVADEWTRRAARKPTRWWWSPMPAQTSAAWASGSGR